MNIQYLRRHRRSLLYHSKVSNGMSLLHIFERKTTIQALLQKLIRLTKELTAPEEQAVSLTIDYREREDKFPILLQSVKRFCRRFPICVATNGDRLPKNGVESSLSPPFLRG